MVDVSLGLALLAGFVSFISPCVLPLVPAYISYMGGRMTNTIAAQVEVKGGGTAVMTTPTLAVRFGTLLHGMAFVAGFTFIFVIIGVLSTALIQQIGGQNLRLVTDIIGRLGGIVIIFFGLHFMGVLPSVFKWLRSQKASRVDLLIVGLIAVSVVVILLWGFTGYVDVWNIDTRFTPIWATVIGGVAVITFMTTLVLGRAFDAPGVFLTRLTNTIDSALYSDTRQEMTSSHDGLLGSALMGIVFAAGWTPCIGPVYGAILTMSANTGNVSQALPLLTAYSLGLGIPFLLCALALDSAQGILRRLRRHMKTIKMVSGAMLVFIGVLVASGRLQELSLTLSVQFADTSVRVEECVVGWAEGGVYFNQLGSCLNGEVKAEELKAQNLE